MVDYILVLDEGTTSTRPMLFASDGVLVTSAQEELTQHYPQDGWVEHDAGEIWAKTLACAHEVIPKAGGAAMIAGIGITNQRETTVIWDDDGPMHNAIVWQDRRTAAICEDLRKDGHEERITEITGLVPDPYFSGTKVKWLLDTVGRRDGLRFGTIDSWLIWKMTGQHVTDATNASRTLLYDIHDGSWSAEMCALLDVPMEMLPDVRDCAADFGTTDLFGAPVPILGVAGDQQAAMIGQACFAPGMLKSTYGTGCFALLNTGDEAVMSKNRLLTTIAYQLDGKRTYALEGSIFVAGAVVQWLRDGLGIIETAADTEALAPEGRGEVIVVPAFTGLGAPYWNSECRGAVYGLTRDTTRADMARAALESVGFQTRDLLDAMHADWPGADDAVLRVDGGLAANDWAMQFLADILGASVDRPAGVETTALGAAWRAGMKAGLYPDQAGFAESWARDRRFEPDFAQDLRGAMYHRWQKSVEATLLVPPAVTT